METNQKDKPSFRQHFEKLKRGFEETGKYRFCAEIGGKKLALYFPSKDYAEEALKSLGHARIPDTDSPDAHLYFDSDDCSKYIEQDFSNEKRRYREKDRWIISFPNRWLIAADIPNRNFYYCMHSPEKRAPIAYWRVSALMSQWAETAGLLPMHGGAVGTGGKGVLLLANSGGGKSTLAASCLLSGMDYVADDYVLLTGQEELIAMPLFSTVKMNSDMKKELKLDLPAICEDPAKPGKQLLDASSFQICRKLPVYAIVFLSRGNRDCPEIAPASGNIPVRLMRSALRAEGAYDPLAAKALVQRLSKLPASDMRLGDNLKQNADAIRAWIERM